MLNTYINDNMLTPYPFASDTRLPFPYSVFSGLSVCVHGTAQFSTVVVTGVEITDDTVSASLALDGTTYIGLLTSKHGAAAEGVFEHATFKAHVLMSIGIVPPSARGTFVLNAPLDASCVSVMPDNCLGLYDHVTVNGIRYAPGECVAFEFSSYLHVTDSGVSQDGYRQFYIDGDVPATAVLTVAASVTNYAMVTSVNGNAVTMSEDFDGTLELDVEAPDGAAQDVDTKTYISISIENAIMSDDVDKQPEGPNPDPGTGMIYAAQAGERSVYWCNLNDDLGDAVILTITGTHKIPSCYGSDDEAGEDN